MSCRMNEYYSSLQSLTRSLLKSVGQVFFQEHTLTGALILLGIGLTSISSMLYCLLATFVGVIAARMLRYERKSIEQGLYGFNSALVGLAMILFFEPTPLSISVLVLGSVASTALAHLFNTRLWGKGYTFPFIAVVWAILAISPLIGLEPTTASPITYPDSFQISWVAFLGFGQVMFQGYGVVAGLLFFVAVRSSSRDAAFSALIGLIVGLLALLLPGVEVWQMNAGLYGYNAILSAMALASSSGRGVVRATIGATVATLLQYAGLRLGLPTLTAPFVFSVWLVQLSEQFIFKKSSTH